MLFHRAAGRRGWDSLCSTDPAGPVARWVSLRSTHPTGAARSRIARTMGFAALYPSYGGARSRIARTMGFAALYPSYGEGPGPG